MPKKCAAKFSLCEMGQAFAYSNWQLHRIRITDEVQSDDYKESVLPPPVTARVGIEAGVQLGWERYLGPKSEFIGMSSFGASAPANDAFEGFGLTVENVVNAAKRVMS